MPKAPHLIEAYLVASWAWLEPKCSGNILIIKFSVKCARSGNENLFE